RKMSLSIKQMSQDPWSSIETQFPQGSKHKGLVKNITPYGVFVELSPGIGGMIHISDLSWLKRFNNPNEYTKTGNDIDVVIMSIDKDNRKLQLGHKQIEEDPWNSLEETFPVGSIHEGTVTRRDDKGALVQLPYGLEGFAPARHLFKEDDKTVVADEIAQFMVIEFDRNDKRIVLSHSKVWQQAKEEEKQAENKERRAENESTKKAVKNIQSKVEKTTLGDLTALADLKKKMDDDGESTANKAEGKEPKAEVKIEIPESKAEPKYVAKTESTEVREEPKAEVKTEVAETSSEPKAEINTEVAEIKSEPKDEVKTESAEDRTEPEVQTETPEIKAEVKPESPEVKEELKAEVKTEVAETSSEPQAEVKTEIPEVKEEPKAEVKTETPDVKAEVPTDEAAEVKPAKAPKAKKAKTDETADIKTESNSVDIAEITAAANIVPEVKGEDSKESTEGKAE
ncbi:MAG: S1 RNA-binding domain-containing protein, partial [Chitinophagaceae bacterium]